MKKLITSDITDSVGMPVKAGTLRHIQESYTEAVAELAKAAIGNGYGAAPGYILNGVVNGSAHPTYNTGSGSLFINGEIFLVDAASFTLSGGQTAIFVLDETFATGSDADSVEFTDGINRNVHQIRKAKLQGGTAGTGMVNFPDCARLNNNRPDVTIGAGNAGIAIGGAWPNYTVSNLYPPTENPVLAHRKISLGDFNPDPGDGYTSRLSGATSGFAMYVHNFPTAISGDFIIVLNVGNAGYNATADMAANYMCSVLLGQQDANKFYFAVQTSATGNAQDLDIWYTVFRKP